MSGLDPVLGFVKRTLEDLVEQVAADEVAELSPSLDVSSTSPMGQFNGVVMKVAAELWDLAEAEYIAMDPDRNTGDGQDAICAITGTTREPANNSQVAALIAANSGGITIPVGFKVAVLGNPTTVFQLIGDTVTLGPIITTAAGTYVGLFEAIATGPVVANAHTLSVFITPVTGITGVDNPSDATLGHDVEGSSALRLRREQELAAAGSTPVDALRGELYRLLAANNIVGFVDVKENVGDVADADGRPAHSVEALIDDGVSPLANTAIAQVIWDGRAGGIRSFGATTANATDSTGVTRAMSFNRPTAKPVYFAVSIVIDTILFPGDGDTQIKTAMVAHGKTLNPGDDVARASFFGAIFSVAGVTNCTLLHLGFAAAPTLDADLVIAVRERATFDTSRITITHV